MDVISFDQVIFGHLQFIAEVIDLCVALLEFDLDIGEVISVLAELLVQF